MKKSRWVCLNSDTRTLVDGGGKGMGGIRHPAGTSEILIKLSLYFSSTARHCGWVFRQSVELFFPLNKTQACDGIVGSCGFAFKGSSLFPALSYHLPHSVPILFKAHVIYCVNSSTAWCHCGVCRVHNSVLYSVYMEMCTLTHKSVHISITF